MKIILRCIGRFCHLMTEAFEHLLILVVGFGAERVFEENREWQRQRDMNVRIAKHNADEAYRQHVAQRRSSTP